MATTDNRSATDWHLTVCKIQLGNNRLIDLRNNLMTFKYFEDLTRLNPVAVIKFADNKQNINVSEGDVVSIAYMTSAHTDDDNMIFHGNVEKIQTDSAGEDGKIYTCSLVSTESIAMSKWKATDSYKGNGYEILQKVFADAEFEPQIEGDGNAPFNPLIVTASKKPLKDVVYDICSQSIPASGKTMNTCGYFCWGTKKNMSDSNTYKVKFKSIDSLLAVGGAHNGADAEYSYYQASEAVSLDMPAQLIIGNFSVTDRGNCKKMCDDGVFLANAIVYNTDTKKYTKKLWNISEYWDRWGHIAKTEGSAPWERSKLLKEFMSAGKANKTFKLEISHENFHDDEEKADPGQLATETNSQSATYQDWDEETIVQYKARRATMQLTTANITVPGNQYLHAGDKIKLYLRDSRPDHKTSVDSYDKELSGHYLIYRLCQYFSMVPKKECWTAATLVRDTINKNC